MPLEPQTLSLRDGETGWTYERIFGPYLAGAVRITIEDPYLSNAHQLRNLTRLAELICRVNDCYELLIVTRRQRDSIQDAALDELRGSLKDLGITMAWKFSETLHDRCVRLSNGWKVVLGRGLDLWQKPADVSLKYFVGAFDMGHRKTRESEIHILKE